MAVRADIAELLAYPREALDIEIKEWLDLDVADHKAKVAKEIIALANFGGGYLVIGFQEQAGGGFAVDDRVFADDRYTQDSIQSIVDRYIEPQVQCAVSRVRPPGAAGDVIAIGVPGGGRVPVRAKAGSPDGKLVAGRVYLRRPGPKSQEPQTAADWDALFERCIRARTDELMDTVRSLLSGQLTPSSGAVPREERELDAFIAASTRRWGDLVSTTPEDASPRLLHGFYEVAAAVRPPIQSDDISAFRHTFQSALRNHSGWPPFVYLDNERFRPRPVDGAIEAWIGQDEYGHFEIPSRSDFWRASPRGLFFTRFGFAEDGRFAGVQPGTGFDRTNPTWRVGECLLQIFCVCDALGVSDRDVVLHFKLSGLKGRELISAGNRSRMWSGQKFVSAQDDYVTRQVVQARSIDQNLPELVFGLLKPAYALFDFFDLPRAVVEEELRDMRRHDFGM